LFKDKRKKKKIEKNSIEMKNLIDVFFNFKNYNFRISRYKENKIFDNQTLVNFLKKNLYSFWEKKLCIGTGFFYF
jgi:hypothetical protein